jgi:hypothetical protein
MILRINNKEIIMAAAIQTNPIPQPQASVQAPSSPTLWHQRMITKLDASESKLDKLIPNFALQNGVDYFLSAIEQKLSGPWSQLNTWLQDSGNSHWSFQFATFLAKLPFKAACNILRMLGDLIHGALYTAVHPLKAAIHFAKAIISLINELSKPENWPRIAAGALGASLGHTAVTGNPLAVIACAISGVMILSGVSYDLLKSALKAEEGQRWNTAKNHLISQAAAIAEQMTTGLCMGLLIGGIQRRLQGKQNTAQIEQARAQLVQQQGKEFIREHHLPLKMEYSFDNGQTEHVLFARIKYTGKNISVSWKNFSKEIYREIYAEERYHPSNFPRIPGTQYFETGKRFGYKFPLKNWQAPPPPPLPAPQLTQAIPAIGAAPALANPLTRS